MHMYCSAKCHGLVSQAQIIFTSYTYFFVHLFVSFLCGLSWAIVLKESEVARSCLTLATPWTIAYQAPQSMEFSRQEYWSGLPFPSPGESSQPRDWTWVSPIAGRRFTVSATREAQQCWGEVQTSQWCPVIESLKLAVFVPKGRIWGQKLDF